MKKFKFLNSNENTDTLPPNFDNLRDVIDALLEETYTNSPVNMDNHRDFVVYPEISNNDLININDILTDDSV